MWNGPEYDCQRCGACCVPPAPYDGTCYVSLDGQEAKQMRRLGVTVVHGLGDSFLGCRPHRGAGGRPACVALRGKVGTNCHCSIYDDRPHVCRWFEVGSRLCREARQESGLPV